jgi:hypothetical protein
VICTELGYTAATSCTDEGCKDDHRPSKRLRLSSSSYIVTYLFDVASLQSPLCCTKLATTFKPFQKGLTGLSTTLARLTSPYKAMDGERPPEDHNEHSFATTDQSLRAEDFGMTLVFNSIGHLIQGQFGLNELASAVVVGKTVGSIISRRSDGNNIQKLADLYGLFVRDIPKYLSTFKFDRSGTVLGGRQDRFKVQNVLEDVSLNTTEGIATMLVLILRHVESQDTIVDELEELLKGRYWLVGRPRKDYQQTLPFATREVLRTFVSGVIDADADSVQTNELRRLMTKLVVEVGSSRFLESVQEPSQHEQERILSWLLACPTDLGANERHPIFHTLSAGAVMIGLAAAANGANIQIKCTVEGRDGRPEEVVLFDPSCSHSTPDNLVEVHLWLTQPSPDVAEKLRSILTREDFEPRTVFSGALPVFGGAAEISKLISGQLGCKSTMQECLDFWEAGVANGMECTWGGRIAKAEGEPMLIRYSIDTDSLDTDKIVPPDLMILANRHFRTPRTDIRHKLAQRAACIFHQVLNYKVYEGYDTEDLQATFNLIIIAILTGWMHNLMANTLQCLTNYAWTADCKRLLGFAESLISQGLTVNRLLLVAARMWGGVTPSFAPDIASNRMAMGIACPQTTILANVLSNPELLATHGISKGLFTLHQGSIPTLPRDQHSGLIFAGSGRYRRPPQSLDARDQIPTHGYQEPKKLIFTIEPVKHEDGVLAAVLCAWQYGDAIIELDPSQVLCGLTGKRRLSSRATNSSPNRTKSLYLSHMSSTELLKYPNGYTIINGVALVRAGSRVDLQVVAAGLHGGARTIMIHSNEDAGYICRAQTTVVSDSMKCVVQLDEGDEDFDDRTAVIFCRDDFPPGLGEAERETDEVGSQSRL